MPTLKLDKNNILAKRLRSYPFEKISDSIRS